MRKTTTIYIHIYSYIRIYIISTVINMLILIIRTRNLYCNNTNAVVVSSTASTEYSLVYCSTYILYVRGAAAAAV